MYFSEEFVNKLFRIGFLLTVILVLLDIISFFSYPDLKISEIFLATREQTPLTWVSVVVLLLLGLSSYTAYMHSKNKYWYALSVIFLFFSMDDATYFHERLSSSLQELIPILNKFPSYSWVLIYLPFLVFGLSALVYFLWKNSTHKEKNIIKVSIILLGLALFLDMLDGWVDKSELVTLCFDPACSRITIHIFRLIEETFEIVGLGGLAYLNILKNSKLS